MSDFKIVKLLNPITITTNINPRGEYSGATSYAILDSVSYLGSSYVAILPTTGNLPTDTTYWQLLSAQGDPGVDGKTILNGTVNPTTEGVDGDFYINTTTNYIFGPKASGTWPSGISMVGAAGTKWYQGAGTPSSGLGVDGDYYIKTGVASYPFYLKISGAWVLQANLQGPTGPAGANGTNGTDATWSRPQIHHIQNTDVNVSHHDSGWTFVCDTTGGHFQVILPDWTEVDLGFIIYIKDATGNFSKDALVLARSNSNDYIEGLQMNKELRTDFGHWAIWAGEDNNWWVGH